MHSGGQTYIDHQDESARHALGPEPNGPPRRSRRHADRKVGVAVPIRRHGEAEGDLLVLGDKGRLAFDCGGRGRREEVCCPVSLALEVRVGFRAAARAGGCARRWEQGRSTLGATGGGRDSLPARSAAPASAVPILLAVVHMVSSVCCVVSPLSMRSFTLGVVSRRQPAACEALELRSW